LSGKAGYRLSRGVRARREEFGLLFYSSREGKLTFVKSGGLLEVGHDHDGRCGLIMNCTGELREKAKDLCRALRKKGLIDEAETGI
jgi:putative mycofactocin binding protein MftB